MLFLVYFKVTSLFTFYAKVQQKAISLWSSRLSCFKFQNTIRDKGAKFKRQLEITGGRRRSENSENKYMHAIFGTKATTRAAKI
jgi:hypothetical protein